MLLQEPVKGRIENDSKCWDNSIYKPFHKLLIHGAFVQIQVKQLLQTSLSPPVVVDGDRVAGVGDLVVGLACVLVLIVVRVLHRLGGRLTVGYLGIVRVG